MTVLSPSLNVGLKLVRLTNDFVFVTVRNILSLFWVPDSCIINFKVPMLSFNVPDTFLFSLELNVPFSCQLSVVKILLCLQP